MKYEINLDCDGVLAGFDEHVFALTGISAAYLEHHDMLWRTLEHYQRFFRDLPRYQQMVDFALEMKAAHSIRVITGRPRRDTMPFAEQDKKAWIASVLGEDVETIVCLSRHKHHHLRKIPNLTEILIDDRMDNIDRWARAGGVGIFHDGNIDKTIALVRATIQ